ncbi:MAG: phosphatase PAP2 family protein [Rhodobiaceae bacterium]|nr:phosphatase PAP2 family protein [Rhodobiaceae bacterium]
MRAEHQQRQSGGGAGGLFCRAARHPIIAGTVCLALVSVFFLLFPRLDLAASRLFYVGDGVFPADGNGALRQLRDLGRLVTWVAGIGSALALIYLAATRRNLDALRKPAFLLLTLGLGPGLLVSAMKALFGRARPKNTLPFGGDSPFSPPWEIVEHCVRTCSFISGEAAASFWLIAFAFVTPPRWRRQVAAGALAFAFVISLNRIAFGAHFLSDVVIAWILTLLVILALRVVMLEPGRR